VVGSVKNFVIVYDPDQGQLVDMRSFDDAGDALARRFAAELVQPAGYEIVVLRGRSEADIRRSHPRYFAAVPPHS
jgi:hypothetical protein